MTATTVDKKELRQFGLISGAIVVVLFGLLLPWLFGHALPRWPWLVAGILWLWALLLPATMQPLYRGWMAFGHVAGWINSRILLGIMFYLLILPLGLIMRLFGKDPMRRQLDKQSASYRVQSIKQPKNHPERPF